MWVKWNIIIFYYYIFGTLFDPDKGHADFLLNKIGGEIVPVEVGYGKS